MKFDIKRDIENRVLSTEVIFTSYGNDKLSPEEEVEIYNDFGYAKVDVGGKFDSTEDGVSFVLNKKEEEVREGFKASFSVKIDGIVLAAASATEDDKIKAAQERCKLFETTIMERLRTAIAEKQGKASDFIDGYPKEETV